MAPNVAYPAVCATRQPIPVGHEACTWASSIDLLTPGERAHACEHSVILGACLTNVKASEIAARLEEIALAAGTDPAPSEGGP